MVFAAAFHTRFSTIPGLSWEVQYMCADLNQILNKAKFLSFPYSLNMLLLNVEQLPQKENSVYIKLVRICRIQNKIIKCGGFFFFVVQYT